jgi:hypothetical protein
MMANLLEETPESAVAAGFFSVEEFAGFYANAIARAMREAGMMMFVPMLEALRFQVGPPITVDVRLTEEGAVEKRIRVPLSCVTNIVTGVQQAMMGQNMNPVP